MPSSRTLRTFLAIPLEPAQRSEIQQQLSGLREQLAPISLRWIPQKNWHLTLKFLGNTELQMLPTLITALQEELLKQPVQQLKLTHIDWFPGTSKPTILAALPDTSESLSKLALSINKLLLQYGFRCETRTFRAHLSLARVKTKIDPKGYCCLPTALAPVTLPVLKINLLQSQLENQAVYYSKLATFPLLA